MDDPKVLVYEALKQGDMTTEEMLSVLFPDSTGYDLVDKKGIIRKGIRRLIKWDWIEVKGYVDNPRGRKFCKYGIKGDVHSFSSLNEFTEVSSNED